jgi:hypothetical protein
MERIDRGTGFRISPGKQKLGILHRLGKVDIFSYQPLPMLLCAGQSSLFHFSISVRFNLVVFLFNSIGLGL